MPRHRKESGPRHGTLRRDTGSRRSVVPRGPAFGPAFGLDASRGLRPATRRSRLRLARSLLATPWFAAGAGIMIAAVLAVDSPTALTYGPTFPGPRCPVHRCGSAAGHGRGPSATATPGIALKAPGLEMKGGGTGRAIRPGGAARGTLVGYRIVRRWSAGFIAVITIARVTKPAAWSLRFDFRAARVDHVWGARWQPYSDGNGGTADGPLPASWHSPWTRGLDADQVMVSATGRPGAPSGCVLDGIRCRFG